MASFMINFGTPQPVPFKEYCSDTEFLARVSGKAEIMRCNTGCYGEGDAGVSALKSAIAAMIPDCFKCWPDGKLIMDPENRRILEDLLAAKLLADGTEARFEIRDVSLVEGQRDKYMAECGNAPDKQMIPLVSIENLEEEKHGPLTCFSLNYCSHSMMAGGGSSRTDELEWNGDGTVTLTSSYSGGGKNTRSKYNVKPEIARKMRDYVTEKRLARLSKEDIKPALVFDNFTSASFSMSFDDSSVGGSPYEHCYVNCGPAGMTFRTIENELSQILDECRETGEIILNEETETDGSMGFAGYFNKVMQSIQPADTWTCSCCGQAGNTGKYCFECGSKDKRQ